MQLGANRMCKGVVSVPPISPVGGSVSNLRVHLRKVLVCVLLASPATLVYTSASERVAADFQPALAGLSVFANTSIYGGP